jgi:hypothetical protein
LNAASRSRPSLSEKGEVIVAKVLTDVDRDPAIPSILKSRMLVGTVLFLPIKLPATAELAVARTRIRWQ